MRWPECAKMWRSFHVDYGSPDSRERCNFLVRERIPNITHAPTTLPVFYSEPTLFVCLLFENNIVEKIVSPVTCESSHSYRLCVRYPRSHQSSCPMFKYIPLISSPCSLSTHGAFLLPLVVSFVATPYTVQLRYGVLRHLRTSSSTVDLVNPGPIHVHVRWRYALSRQLWLFNESRVTTSSQSPPPSPQEYSKMATPAKTQASAAPTPIPALAPAEIPAVASIVIVG